MNTILLFLSDYKDKDRLGNPVQEQEYTYQNGSKYTGIQTNEAPIRCLNIPGSGYHQSAIGYRQTGL